MLKCSPCEKIFTGKENYDQHMVSKKHMKKVSSSQLFKTQGVSDDLTGAVAGDFNNGIATSKPEFNNIECEACNISFDTFENFHRHSVTLEHALKVQLKISKSNCNANVSSTTNSDNYEAHSSSNDTKHDDEIVIGFNREYVKPQCSSYKSCDICNMIFSGPEPYKQHIESANHKKKELQNNNSSANGTNQTIAPFSCETCKKIFSGEVPYKQHMDSEINKKKQLQHSQVQQHFQSYVGYSPEKSEVKNANPWFCYVCKIHCSGFAPFQQHIKSSAHNKKSVTQGLNNELKSDSERKPPIQESNYNPNGVLDALDNVPKLLNGSIQRNNQEIEDDILVSEIGSKLKVIGTDELEQLMKIFLPDQQIEFDQLSLVHEDNFHEETCQIKEKSEVYQICSICNVELFDKDSAAQHFESKEHYEKKWGDTV